MKVMLLMAALVVLWGKGIREEDACDAMRWDDGWNRSD